jgi:hypothetical protein
VPHTFAVFECVGDQDGSYELPGREKANPTHSNGRNEWGTVLVTPFGQRIAGSHPLAKSGREGWGTHV